MPELDSSPQPGPSKSDKLAVIGNDGIWADVELMDSMQRAGRSAARLEQRFSEVASAAGFDSREPLSSKDTSADLIFAVDKPHWELSSVQIGGVDVSEALHAGFSPLRELVVHFEQDYPTTRHWVDTLEPGLFGNYECRELLDKGILKEECLDFYEDNRLAEESAKKMGLTVPVMRLCFESSSWEAGIRGMVSMPYSLSSASTAVLYNRREVGIEMMQISPEGRLEKSDLNYLFRLARQNSLLRLELIDWFVGSLANSPQIYCISRH